MKTSKSKNSTLTLEKEDNKNLNSIELIKRTEVKNTPFTIISTENEHFGTMGKYRITEKHDTLEKAIEDVEKITWNRIVQVLLLLNESILKEEVKEPIFKTPKAEA